ncbi:MAG: hypothetical protein AAGM38_03080 [Pseudomonadota bacterium]
MTQRRFAAIPVPRRALAAAALIAAACASLAAPQDALARHGASTLDRAKIDAAAGVAEAAAHAVLLAAFSGRAAALSHQQALADEIGHADPSLFIGPYDAWVVSSAHAHRDGALAEAEALARRGVFAEVVATFDGAYEVTLGADRFTAARDALRRWRAQGLLGRGSRLTDGSNYRAVIWSAAEFDKAHNAALK